ncbi:MAG: hypothetical protein DMG91_16835, partial [Acidobacteria bacterium]
RTWSRSAVIRWRITELERVRFVMKDGKVVRDDFAKPQSSAVSWRETATGIPSERSESRALNNSGGEGGI